MTVNECLGHKWLQEDSPPRILSISNISMVKDLSGKEINTDEITEEFLQKTNEDDFNGQSSSSSVTTEDESEKDMSSLGSCSTSSLSSPGSTEDILSLRNHHNGNFRQDLLFPNAPTTPKVSRKASISSPPSVKALVKKFQQDLEKEDHRSTKRLNNPNSSYKLFNFFVKEFEKVS